MKKNFMKGLVLFMAVSMLLAGCGKKETNKPAVETPAPVTQTQAELPDINVEVNDTKFTVRLYESDTTYALAGQVPKTDTGMLLPTSYDVDGIYKYYDIPERYLPALNIKTENITQAKAGEMFVNNSGRLFLYLQDSQLSEDLMKIGYVLDMEGIADALGTADLQFRVSAVQK